MIYPENFENKIGFTQIRDSLANLCLGSLGQSFVQRMQFVIRFDLLQKLLNQTNEFREVLISGQDFPTQYYFNVNEHLNRAMLEGA